MGWATFNWSYLGSCRASGGVLVMWDTRVVNKMEEAMGDFRFLVSLQTCQISFFGRFLVFTVLIYTETGGFIGGTLWLE